LSDGDMMFRSMAGLAAAVTGGSSVAFAARGLRAGRRRRMVVAAGACDEVSADSHRGWPGGRRLLGSTAAAMATLGLIGATGGWLVAGPMGAVIGAVVGTAGPLVRQRRKDHAANEAMEGQLAQLAESMALALRSGLAVVQAIEFFRNEAVPPLNAVLDRLAEERRLGVPFETALDRMGKAIGTDDATLFVLVTGLHARTGGDLAGALDEVARTIRHRVSMRRELRAASAQGRISGAIMGALPIAFFLFLSVTTHDKLAPVLRTGAGMTMVGVGLAMEVLAYLWIRRLLRVET
jgi:tight adherence protein B